MISNSKDSNKENSKDSNKDNNKENSKDSNKDNNKDNSKENNKDSNKDITKQPKKSRKLYEITTNAGNALFMADDSYIIEALMVPISVLKGFLSNPSEISLLLNNVAQMEMQFKSQMDNKEPNGKSK